MEQLISFRTTERPHLTFGWESLLLFVICTADMLTTLYWVHTHQATEANPCMAFWLQHGDLAFCCMKLISFVPFLLIAAYYRPRRPRLIAIALRGTLILYVLTYALSIAAQGTHLI